MTKPATPPRPQGKHESRRYEVNGRIVILPPEGHGDAWSGSSAREVK